MKGIVTAIDISASAARVWRVLTDFWNYPAWNPFIQKTTGKPAKNTDLEVQMPDPNGSTTVLTPTVLVAEKDIEQR